jgi:hypothetical protein
LFGTFEKMLMRVYQHRKGAVMNSKLKTPAVEQLFDAILSLENKEECAAFFEDLCTINELMPHFQKQLSFGVTPN